MINKIIQNLKLGDLCEIVPDKTCDAYHDCDECIEYIINLLALALNTFRAVEILKENSLPDYKSPYLDGDDYE